MFLQNSEKATKFLLALKIRISAANAISFHSGTPYLSIDASETFSQRGRQNLKTKNLGSSSFIRGTKNSKEVYVAAVWHKIVTTPLRYFLLVALYYCKIGHFATISSTFLPMFCL